MQRRPETETLGPLEPAFAALHAEHLKDETRHLQIDGQLVERCLARARPRTRALNARLFARLVETATRPTRAGSGVKVVRQLVREMPELSRHEGEMVRALLALRRDRAFQQSLFNRAAMPLTFGVFDRAEELRGLGRVMIGYERR
jgi:hypothetical protein